MPQKRIRAAYVRGGTSKGVIFRRDDLPDDMADWAPIFLEVMGSPDANRRQLDGMGGGLSSLSKICVVGVSNRPDADVDYTFAQIGIADGSVDYGGTCGNMASAIGPFAVEEGLVPLPLDGEAVVRIHITNTSKLLVSRFPVDDGEIAPSGDLVLDGVSGTAAPIRLEFLDPGGAKSGSLLPSGNPRDTVEVDGLGAVEASFVDAANPCVFVSAADLGLTGDESPESLDADRVFHARMEELRCAGSVAMGVAADRQGAANVPSIPKVAIIAAPRPMRTLAGRSLSAADMDIAIRMVSVGQAHRAVPLTGALCLAIAARIPGSIPHRLSTAADGPIRIAHASGVTLVDAAVAPANVPGGVRADYAAVYRTTRRLFEGNVLYRGAPPRESGPPMFGRRTDECLRRRRHPREIAE